MITDTICAVSTAPGVGGIAVVRVSGSEAVTLVAGAFRPASGASLGERPAGSATFGRWHGQDGSVTDEVIATLFRAPHSFTGEDTVEISCHGSLYIQQQLVRRLIDVGCRLAEPGEFTRRAFLNGKMDLSQAEAVADLIASTSAATHRLAMNQMRGDFSHRLMQLRERLLNFASLIELELDFSEEEVEFANRDLLAALADEIEGAIRQLADSFSVGNAIKNGIPTAIVGETNAGKSTLLNRLLHEERAIVSDIHGTTRDVIEDTVVLGGLTFRFIDTAGIRQTTDQIENLGIERTFRKLDQASIVLWLIDSTTPLDETEDLARRIVPRCEDKQLILLFNKTDQLTPEKQQALTGLLPHTGVKRLFISAANDPDLSPLEQLLLQAAQLPETGLNDVIVTNARHYEALQNAHAAILRVQQGLANRISGDFMAQDIRECMHYIGEITGQISTDEILGTIFGRFCIGK